jgi:hypothetical protein
MTAMQQRDMNDSERYAKARLESILGSFRCMDYPGGPPGLHDFEADLPNGKHAAIEITGEENSKRLAQEAAVEDQALDSIRLPSSRLFWLVHLASTARVRAVSEEVLRALLSDLEAAGMRSASDMGDSFRDPFVQRLRDLRIESVHGFDAKTGGEGTVIVEAGSYGGWGWPGSVVDDWLQALLQSPRGVNKLKKLARATTAAQRHLVVVLDGFTPAGMGISLTLTARQDRGAAEFEMPSLALPQPVTHTWILPRVLAEEGLIWTREAGWSVFTLPPISST